MSSSIKKISFIQNCYRYLVDDMIFHFISLPLLFYPMHFLWKWKVSFFFFKFLSISSQGSPCQHGLPGVPHCCSHRLCLRSQLEFQLSSLRDVPRCWLRQINLDLPCLALLCPLEPLPTLPGVYFNHTYILTIPGVYILKMSTLSIDTGWSFTWLRPSPHPRQGCQGGPNGQPGTLAGG